jgi:DNA-binding HxlR family transcriptional regulator
MPVTKTPRPVADSTPSKVKACPVEKAIGVIGGKWKLLLLRSLLLNGSQGYNQLLASVNGISSKELTRNLAELNRADLIVKAAETSARTARYELTPLGKKLMPTFKSLLKWGEKLLASNAAHISVR